MITCVTWLPPNAAKEWPDKTHAIPIKHLPVKIDRFMPVHADTADQFLDEEDMKQIHQNDIKIINDNADIVDEDGIESSNSNDNIDDSKPVNEDKVEQFLDEDDIDTNEDIDITENNDNDTNKKDESQSSNLRKRKYSDLQKVDSDNPNTKKHKTDQIEEEEEDDEEEEEESDEERLVDFENEEDFTKAVMEGYDDQPLDFISRIGGLQGGIAIGPIDYSYSSEKKNRSKEKRLRIINAENIYDTANDSEIEDIHIKPTDEIFLCLGCDADRESSSMQVNVFDTQLRTFYEHHDITLAAFPLCCKWLSFNNLGTNLLAIGSVEESIEIFNLDVMDALEPVCCLGGRMANEKGLQLLSKWNEDIMFNYTDMDDKQKNMTLGSLKEGSHSDAVLCLDWSKSNDSYLFSGSSDKSIKIWDLNKRKCVNTANHHSGKVQQIKLKPNDPTVLLSGGFDKNIYLSDLSLLGSRKRNKARLRWTVLGEIETLTWHPGNDNLFVCSLDNGYIECFDIRKINVNESIWRLKGHRKAVTSLSFNKDKSDLFATGSLDKKIKLWHQEIPEKKPILLSEESNDVTGGIFTIEFAPKRLISSILIIGGQSSFGMWDVWSDMNVKTFYASDDDDDDKKKEDEIDHDVNIDGAHQHLIMEQSFNFKEDTRIAIGNQDHHIEDFVDDD